ncbi:hypothetical protein AAVH_27307 [Aphelenchoides avenae]|nr:hypothetical protein AAVH_27307 [Aphelenchus avenae]
MVFYAPLNYIIIFAFITQLRNELKRLFNRLLCITGLSKTCQGYSGVHFSEQSQFSMIMKGSNVHVGDVSIRRLS